jgi:hypothetical protein
MLPAERFRYQVIERSADQRIELAATPTSDGALCFQPRSVAPSREHETTFEIRNGTAAGPLVIHAYDLGARGMFVAGVTRPEP